MDKGEEGCPGLTRGKGKVSQYDSFNCQLFKSSRGWAGYTQKGSNNMLLNCWKKAPKIIKATKSELPK